MNVYVSYLKRKLYIIVLFSLIGGIIGYTYAYLQKTTYTATLTFALEDEKASGGGMSSALGLASSLGIDVGGGNAGGAFSSANLIELIRSRRLVEKALLNAVSFQKENKSLADFYVEFNGMNKNWGTSPVLKSLNFNPSVARSTYSMQQDSILGIIFQQITGPKGILSVSQKDKKSSIISIEVKCENELFAKWFTEALANEVSDFYIDTKSKKAKLNFLILQKQTDSVQAELNSALSGAATATDNNFNLNPALNVKRVSSTKKQVDVQLNTAILTQLVTNLEMAKVALRKETPLIQIIDSPILPLNKEKPGKSKMLILGAFLGAFFTGVFLIVIRVYKNIMN